MIADRTTSIAVRGNLDGDRVAMSIDDAAMEHIMSILTDLYSDPEAAIIREYSTNALDAHVEAGVNRPIEVELPSPLAPFLRIRDFGIGLSVEDIHDIYSKYGASTKRATNDQVGMLGLGCKSALTYTDQFTLTSVKDGTRSQVVVSRDDNGSGSMTIVDVSPTNEPNGTEVLIPAKRHNTLEAKAQDFFKFWQPGTVLVNGKPPQGIEGLRVTDRLTVVDVNGDHRYFSATDFVVMGNVAYPATIEHGLPYGYRLVAHVDIGAVNFTPSREALHMTAKTKATLAAVAQDFKAHREGAIQREVDKAPTASEAVITANTWHEVLMRTSGGFNYTFKGRPVPQTFTTAFPDTGITVVPRNSHVLNRCTKLRELPAGYVRKALWVHGYERPKFTSAMKKRINKWAEENALPEFESLILTQDAPDITWIDKSRVFKWADIAAVKLPRAAVTRSGRIPGSYDLYDTAGVWRSGVPADDIDTAKPVFYIEGATYTAAAVMQILREQHGDCTLVPLPSPRVAKFVRNFPQAKSGTAEVKRAFAKWSNSLSKDQRAAMEMYAQGRQGAYSNLDPTKLDDPELARCAKLARMDLTKDWNRRSLFRQLGMSLDTSGTWHDPLHRYPLVNHHTIKFNPEHTALYVNAVYAANQKEG